MLLWKDFLKCTFFTFNIQIILDFTFAQTSHQLLCESENSLEEKVHMVFLRLTLKWKAFICKDITRASKNKRAIAM